MQPLYSVDHETRQNSNRRDDVESAITNEDTPLLRFPANQVPVRNPATTLIVSGLLMILVLGVIIGIYLLIIQNNAENILPPIETPLQLVGRSQWDPTAVSRPLTMVPMEAQQVVVVQTDTAECYSTATCTNLLQRLQANKISGYKKLPYNFLVSSNGQTYEALGWHRPSPMFPQYAGMVLAFIGNFTDIGPSREQMGEAQNFFDESTSRRHLTPNFDIIGKNTTYKPVMLFEALRLLNQWNEERSDV